MDRLTEVKQHCTLWPDQPYVYVDRLTEVKQHCTLWPDKPYVYVDRLTEVKQHCPLWPDQPTHRRTTVRWSQAGVKEQLHYNTETRFGVQKATEAEVLLINNTNNYVQK